MDFAIQLINYSEELPFTALHDGFPDRLYELATRIVETFPVDFHGALFDQPADFTLGAKLIGIAEQVHQ